MDVRTLDLPTSIPVIVAALLRPSLLVRLCDAVKELPGILRPAHNWQHLDQMLHKEAIVMAVVDPLVTGRVLAASEIIRLMQRWPAVPIIGYSELTSESARAFATLSRHGLREVVLYQYEDSRVRFGYTLRRAVAYRLVSRLRAGLAPRLAALPIHVAHAVEQLLERPQAFQSGYDLTIVSGETKNTLLRYLQHAKLAPPRLLFVAARVAHAASQLQNPALRVQDVAMKLGYTSAELLTRHTIAVLGVPPRRLRRLTMNDDLTEDEILTRLLTWTQQENRR